MQLGNARDIATTLEANKTPPPTQTTSQGNLPSDTQSTLPPINAVLQPQASDSDSSGPSKIAVKKSKQHTEPSRQSKRDRKPTQHFVATHAIDEEDRDTESQLQSEEFPQFSSVSPRTLLEKSTEDEIRQAMKKARNPVDSETISTTSFDRFLLNLAEAKAKKKAKPSARLEPQRVPPRKVEKPKKKKAKILDTDED